MYGLFKNDPEFFFFLMIFLIIVRDIPLFPLVCLRGALVRLSFQICARWFFTIVSRRRENGTTCTKKHLSGSLQPAFGWVAEAKYTGKRKIRHREYDEWVYSVRKNGSMK